MGDFKEPTALLEKSRGISPVLVARPILDALIMRIPADEEPLCGNAAVIIIISSSSSSSLLKEMLAKRNINQDKKTHLSAGLHCRCSHDPWQNSDEGGGRGKDWLTDRYLTLRTKPPALLVYINNCSPLGGFLQHPQEQEVAAIKQVNVESVLWLVLRSIYNQKGETKAVCNAVIVTSREIKPSCFLVLKQ